MLDPRGLIDTIGVFEETRSSPDSASTIPANEGTVSVDMNRLKVKRSLVRYETYGAEKRRLASVLNAFCCNTLLISFLACHL